MAAPVQGTLFKYGPASIQSAFMTGSGAKGRCHAVFVPGLTDGLMSHTYFKPLGEALEAQQWSLVQPQLSSSYGGWGTASLDQDASELLLLSRHLSSHYDSKGIVLVGHSTGCQDAVRYVQRFASDRQAAPLLGVVLQAPVSDREFMNMLPKMREILVKAEKMVADGKGEDVVERDIFGPTAPVFLSARRMVALMQKNGDDDMFSSDLTDEELSALLGHLAPLPTLVIASGADEYVPPGVDRAGLGERIAAAIGPSATSACIPGGLHALVGKEEEAVEHISSFCFDVAAVGSE